MTEHIASELLFITSTEVIRNFAERMSFLQVHRRSSDISRISPSLGKLSGYDQGIIWNFLVLSRRDSKSPTGVVDVSVFGSNMRFEENIS